MPRVVKVQDLKKTYVLGTVKVPALQGLSFEVNKSEFVSIIGHSGCGKSTLLHLIGCLDHPTSGSVHLDGTNVSTLDDNQLAEIRNKKISFFRRSSRFCFSESASSMAMPGSGKKDP